MAEAWVFTVADYRRTIFSDDSHKQLEPLVDVFTRDVE